VKWRAQINVEGKDLPFIFINIYLLSSLLLLGSFTTVGYFYYRKNLNWAGQNLGIRHSWFKDSI